ncbi:MAG TPA: carboxyl transferase domain-containing protein, partial [Arachnia sp.]|nr:carboxyl transferase domain-containing protein [Arachnia sp.]
LVACCDVIIATESTTLAMGGPAMIEGGGLGIYTPEEVGPMSFQVPNGVVDILVKDETEAVATAKKYLSYFQGAVKDWEAPDQRQLRHIIPENRLRLYDMREIIHTLADKDSVLELRASSLTKGDALRELVRETGASAVAMCGDDLGDLPAFDVLDELRAEGLATCAVVAASAEQPALAHRADVLCEGPEGVAAWLAELARAVEAPLS